MALYTYGGTPADVLTTKTGDVVPDYPVVVRVAGTGEAITALYEADGVTPIGALKTNSAGSSAPGAIRTFKVADQTAIEFEYLDAASNPVRWYSAAREAATGALDQIEGKLDKVGGTLTGRVQSQAANATDDVLASFVTGDTYDRWRRDASGGQSWGSGTAARDTFLRRTGPGVLDTPGTFVAGQVSLTGMRVYNPSIFGTHTAGLQAALNAARDAGGGWVIVPSGVYLITATLRLYRNTRLTLLPGAEFRSNFAGTMLLNGDAAQPFGGYTGHGNILIEGGVWNMRGTTAGMTGNAMCISIGHARGVTIRDIEIRDVSGYHGIELNSTKNALVDNCRFLGYVDNTVDHSRTFSEAVQLDLAKGAGEFGGFGPYDNTVCEDITIRGCYVGASGTAGTTVWPRGVGSHSATVGTTHRRIRIEGNTFEGCLQYGVVAYAYDDCVIAENTMNGCGAGIRCRTIISADAADSTNLAGVQTNASQIMKNPTITGNVISGGLGYDDAILLYGETTGRILGATITGNTIEGSTNAENGVRVYYSDHYTVSGNTLRGVSGTGVSQEQVNGGVVGPNRIYAPGASGISCDTGTGIQIAGNTVREAGVNGIHILGGSDVQVQNNYVRGASRNASGSWGIRCSTSVDGLLITGNKVRKFGSGNEVATGIGITSTCSNVRRYGNDLADTGIDDQSPNPVTSPLDSGAVPLEELMRPAGRYETSSRLRCGTNSTPTSGTLYLVPIWLPKGFVVNNIAFSSSGTAGVSLTNWWFSLHDSAKKMIARTADQLAAAWAASTTKQIAIAQTTAGAGTSYTTTYAGLHYLGLMIKATTVPSIVSEGSIADFLASTAPGFGGTDAGLSAPPTVSGTGFTAGAFGTGSGILAYGTAG